MKTFKTTITMSSDLFEQANKLLDIEDFDELEDGELEALGGDTDDRQELFAARFEDGTAIDLLLVSGNHNYYTTPEIVKGGRLVEMDDSAGFGLAEREVFCIGDTEYVVDIVLQ